MLTFNMVNEFVGWLFVLETVILELSSVPTTPACLDKKF